MSEYAQWFSTVTALEHGPYVWQSQVAAREQCTSRQIRIPTGMGKTQGILSSWSYHLLCRQDNGWPRRLVWCLPMRVLVEQTVEVAKAICARVPCDTKPGVAVLMGGEETEEWFLEPEKPWILVGTQDMLLSRALNRGYASGRARWPIEYGLLNQDALWVMDEVQLMDVGLATSAQLQAYRDEDSGKSLRPCYTWWMSATLQPDWLSSVDTANSFDEWVREPCVVPPEDRSGGLWEISKSITTEAIAATDKNTFAARILEEHSAIDSTEFGKITLVVCNTVDRATETYTALQSAGRTEGLELVHGRFRPAERESWRKQFLCRSSCTPDADRIIVATQVVEAGVDISAGCLITELAPWPSLVQRFGRCARYGGEGRVVVIDRGQDEKSALPYDPESLVGAWAAVQSLPDAGIAQLEEYEEQIDAESRASLYPYEPAHLLMRHEHDELFDTTPDLTGADLDISRFIRSGDERDVHVFWADVAKDEIPAKKRQPQRRELCAVPFLKARDWLCGSETKTNRKPKLRGAMRAWIWDWIDGEWKKARRENLLPGRVVCVEARCGGYSVERGFSPDSGERVSLPTPIPVQDDVKTVDAADKEHDCEPLSVSQWKTIACHSSEVVDAVSRMAGDLKLSIEMQRLLEIAARWHDVGKSHPAFQGAIVDAEGDPRPRRPDLAKGPPEAWLKPPGTYRITHDTGYTEDRPSFRHELASALALFSVLQMYQPTHPALLGPWADVFKSMGQEPELTASSTNPPTPEIQSILNCSADEFDLLVYLVASHHGKVRVALHASPKDQDYRVRSGDPNGLPIRGVRDGDCLPAISFSPDGPLLPELPLTLDPAALGLSVQTGASWRERCQSLLIRHGPGTLALLEAILRAADVEASRLTTEDPVFEAGFQPQNGE